MIRFLQNCDTVWGWGAGNFVNIVNGRLLRWAWPRWMEGHAMHAHYSHACAKMRAAAASSVLSMLTRPLCSPHLARGAAGSTLICKRGFGLITEYYFSQKVVLYVFAEDTILLPPTHIRHLLILAVLLKDGSRSRFS